MTEIPIKSKPGWFLYARDLRHERVKRKEKAKPVTVTAFSHVSIFVPFIVVV